MGAYARQRRRWSRATWRHTPNNGLTEICSLGLLRTSLILDIHIMINWHLSKQGIRLPVSREHIAGSSLQLIEVQWFLKLTADQVLIFIGSRAHVLLTCWKQGRIVRKLVDAHPGLNVNRVITFSSLQMFLLLVLCIWWSLKLKQKAKQYTENLSAKIQNSNQNSTFSWISLIGFWTTRSRSSLLGWTKSIY